jgi:septal ring factor EnvC (AmiA/AmiB activator)
MGFKRAIEDVPWWAVINPFFWLARRYLGTAKIEKEIEEQDAAIAELADRERQVDTALAQIEKEIEEQKGEHRALLEEQRGLLAEREVLEITVAEGELALIKAEGHLPN